MNFTVGQKVCEVDHYGNPQRIHTVAKVGKRKVTLDNGTHWNERGMPWGNDDTWYMGNTLRGARDGDETHIRTTRAVTWATRARWGVVPLEVLEQVYRLVKPHIDEWEKEHSGEKA